MILPADYHMHTPLCRHASGEPEAYAARAVSLGLPQIGFADHSPMPRDDFDDWRMRQDQLDEYVAKVRRAQRLYPKLKVKLGLEVDYLPGQEDWIRSLAARHPWDYLIGSVHYVFGDWAVDNPAQISQWKNREPMEVWTAYFKRLSLAASSGLFDIIGHADLPKKFGFYPRQDCVPLYKEFLTIARDSKVVLELNTAGLRKDCREIYPGPVFVQLMYQFGIPITFGSDAHAETEVGMNFPEAVALARQAGYHSYFQFAQRRRTEVTLT